MTDRGGQYYQYCMKNENDIFTNCPKVYAHQQISKQQIAKLQRTNSLCFMRWFEYICALTSKIGHSKNVINYQR